MAKLIYSMLHSLDGYSADEKGNFDWAEPDEEVHRFVNDLERPVGTHLYGRKMYETMVFWETALDDPRYPSYIRDYAEIWQAAGKTVFSTTLDDVSSARTRIERSFDPDEIRAVKAGAERDISVGGPTLAARAIESGLVDEYQFFVAPVIVGGGTKVLPGSVRQELRLLDERRFQSGFVYLRYGVA